MNKVLGYIFPLTALESTAGVAVILPKVDDTLSNLIIFILIHGFARIETVYQHVPFQSKGENEFARYFFLSNAF